MKIPWATLNHQVTGAFKIGLDWTKLSPFGCYKRSWQFCLHLARETFVVVICCVSDITFCCCFLFGHNFYITLLHIFPWPLLFRSISSPGVVFLSFLQQLDKFCLLCSACVLLLFSKHHSCPKMDYQPVELDNCPSAPDHGWITRNSQSICIK